MKKTIILFIAIGLGAIAHAQKSKQDEGVKIGIKGGLNIANVYGDINDNAIRTSVVLGLFGEFTITDRFSIQPELLYSGQGFSDQNPVGFSRVKLDYLLLPIMAKIYLHQNDLSLEFGPQVGFLVSGKEKTNEANETIENVSKVDFGVNVGLGYELKSNVYFQGRYNLGITNLNSDSSTSGATKYSNAVIQISVGYLF